MYTESLKELSQYTQNMNFVKILLDEKDEEIKKSIFLFRRLKSKRTGQEQEQLVKFYLENQNETNSESLQKLICDDNLLNLNISDQKKLIEYYKNNDYKKEIAVLILRLSEYLNISDVFLLLLTYNVDQNIKIFEILKNRNILENRNCTEIITLIRLLRDKNYDETVEELIKKDSIVKNYSCADQIKLINKTLNIKENNGESVSNIVVENIICSSNVSKNFDSNEIIELIDKYLQKNDKTVLDIITDKNVISNRNLKEILLLVDIYNLNPIIETKFLITNIDILRNLTTKEQIKVIDLYIKNKDVEGLWSFIHSSDHIHCTSAEYFKEIYEHIHRFRNTFSAKEAITKFDNIDDFIKCLESDNVKEINSNTKIYCYIPKEDKK